MIKVLFEPKSKLNDSVTYDITAWSLPFVYGVQTYAVKEKLSVGNYVGAYVNTTLFTTAYGYLVNYNSFADVKFLAALLNAKIKVRYAERDFTYNGKAFKKGTIIILKKGNEDKIQLFAGLAQSFKPVITAVSGGFMDTGFDFGSEKVHLVKSPAVAMLTGKGVNPNAAGEVWHLFEQQLNYPISLINADEVDGNALKNINVLILPDGNYKFLKDKDAAAEIKMWVQQGGKIIALDNAASQIAKAEWGMKIKKNEEEEKKDDKKEKKDE